MEIPKTVLIMTINVDKLIIVLTVFSSSSSFSTMDGRVGNVKIWCSGVVYLLAATVL